MTETYEPETPEDSEQEAPPSDSEEPSRRFRRLLKPDSEEPVEHERLSPNRHPTGSPDLTGGWFAESLNAAESEPEVPNPEPIREREPDPAAPPPMPSATEEGATGPHKAHRATPLLLGPGRRPCRSVSPSATRAPPASHRRPTTCPPPQSNGPKGRLSGLSGCGSLVLRMTILGLFVLTAVLIAALSFGVYEYYAVASTLPAVDDLQSKAAQFETTRILDRKGDLLYEILDPNAGRRTYVKLDNISPYLVAATIATEDAGFYSHPGFDPWAIARAIYQNLSEGSQVSGASTITQQIAARPIVHP